MLEKLGEDLKQRVLQDMYLKLLKEQNFLSKNFSERFLQELSLNIKERNYIPGEILYKENDINQKFILIIKGNIEL